MSAATTRSRTPDRLCADAVDLARTAAEEAAAPGVVGEHVDVVVEGDRVLTHLFESKEPGYRGWRWAVTVARASRARIVTIDETVLLPGPDALLAPEWLPWSERLRPGDLGPGDLLPTEDDDRRLEPGVPAAAEEPPAGPVEGPAPAGDPRLAGGWSGADEPAPDSVRSAEAQRLAAAEEAAAGVDGPPPALPVTPARAEIASVARELGLGRARVLSPLGLKEAAERWDQAFGGATPMAQAAPGNCGSCGFLAPVGGALGQAFGVCANEFAPADGRLVSLTYGCGAHSEAAVVPRANRPPAPVLDETTVEVFPLHPTADADRAPAGTTAEDPGHA
ncbi:DUF3027 domain-containing protein [Streptomyces sp. NPDC049906]|uniref:DUF3027 domain-containing protein n=1 Tax=Streptomyces sp. NPDC049906 TaxID=3155656 RepID=UPI0034376B16